ncbi:MAG: DNA-directed RNA polymerase subunit H [Nanoarchaeota archaeon]
MAEKEIKIEDHFLVPKHVIMTEKEVEELLIKYNISKKQIPQIRVKDPTLKNLDVKSGDIIKITRKSPVQGKSIFFRVVIE